jgi:hypothetical protein
MESDIKLPKGFTTSPTKMKSGDETQFVVMHKEIGYDRKFEQRGVAYYNTETKIARPFHGYFPQHPTGIKMGKFFKSIGYEWDAS